MNAIINSSYRVRVSEAEELGFRLGRYGRRRSIDRENEKRAGF